MVCQEEDEKLLSIDLKNHLLYEDQEFLRELNQNLLGKGRLFLSKRF